MLERQTLNMGMAIYEELHPFRMTLSVHEDAAGVGFQNSMNFQSWELSMGIYEDEQN